MVSFLWFVIPILAADATYSSYKLLLEARARFGKKEADRLAAKPLGKFLIRHMDYAKAAAASWIILSIGLVLLTYIFSHLFGSLLLALGSQESGASLPLVTGLVCGLLEFGALRNRDSLKKMKSGQVWMKDGVMHRKLGK